MRWRWVLVAPLALGGLVLLLFLGGEVVRQLWNWLMPSIFGWQAITFWQALGLLALCRVLFGGCGFRGGPRSHFRHRMAERWERMSPEQRERFRHGLRGRFGVEPHGTGPAD